MDLEKKAKLQSERQLEPSKAVSAVSPAKEPPKLAQPEIIGPQDSADDARLEQIRNRAYAIWLDEGQSHGRDREHWNEAALEIARERKAKA